MGRSTTGASIGVGAAGERAAAAYLQRQKYRVIERNARAGGGEADLVLAAPDRKTLVIAEVKTRRVRPGSPVNGRRPEAALTRAKERVLLRVAKAYARRRGHTNRPLRIDLIAVDLAAEGAEVLDVRHYKAAVRDR